MEITSNLKYRPYAVLIANMDGESLYKKKDEDTSLKPNDIFARECWEYKKKLRSYLYLARDRSPETFEKIVQENTKDRHKNENLDFDDFLFNPAGFVAFGNVNNISIVAMDDFDLATQLAVSPELPIHQTCLAFAPALDSIIPTEERQHFCELKDICNTPFDHKIKSPKLIRAVNHEFLHNSPLVAITYYKLHFGAVLGSGLLLQEAVMKAMKSKINATLNSLRESNERLIFGPDKKKEGEWEKGRDLDIDSFKCCFLDPQGWCDIVTLTFCRNYSVIVSVLAELRKLTFPDILEAMKGAYDNKFEEYLQNLGVYNKILGFFKTDKKSYESGHVFTCTYTTLGIGHEAFSADEEHAHEYYSGVVCAESHLNICPGHIGGVIKASKKMPIAERIQIEDYIWCCVGQNDIVYQQIANRTKTINGVLDLSDFIQEFKNLQNSNDKNGYGASIKRHILSICNELKIPVSKQVPFEDYAEHEGMCKFLDNIHAMVFLQETSPMSIEKLRHSISHLQIPSPLSTALVSVYVDFANSLKNIFLFDNIMDLFDIFQAFYLLLTKGLPEMRDKCSKSDKYSNSTEQYNYKAFLGGESFADLTEMAELLDDALSHRTKITFREAERWNVAVDVRGAGLGRLLNAADAPLKCALGILRWELNEIEAQSNNGNSQSPSVIDKKNRQHIGGASKISYNLKSFSKRLTFGHNRIEYYLASVDLNFSHLTRPRNFHIHFHEVAHMISDLLMNTATPEKCGDCKKRNFCPISGDIKISNLPDDKRFYRDRYSEIFAEMFVYHFIFFDNSPEGQKIYFRNYVTDMALDPTLSHEDKKTYFCMLFESLIRGFFSVDYFHNSTLYQPSDKQCLEETFGRFDTMIKDAGSYLFDYDDFRKEYDGEKTKRIFEQIFEESKQMILCMGEQIDSLSKVARKEERSLTGLSEKELNELKYKISEGCLNGHPIVRELYENSKVSQTDDNDNYLNSLFIVTNILNCHLKFLYADTDTSNRIVCLPRDKNGLFIMEFKNKKLLHRQPIERNNNDFVQLDPYTRGNYILQRITILKTFWDISTTFRARRVKDLIESISQNTPS